MQQIGSKDSRHLQREDKRKSLFTLLQSACDDLPEYSSGDLLYSILRSVAKKNGQSVSFLRGMTDKEIFEEADYRLSIEIRNN